MKKTFLLAALFLAFPICNTVSAANYFMGSAGIGTKNFPGEEPGTEQPRTEISFQIYDSDNQPPIENVVESAKITHLGTEKSGEYTYQPNYSKYIINNNPNIADFTKNVVRLAPYRIVEHRGVDNNQNGKIDLPLVPLPTGEYETRAFSAWEYDIKASDFSLDEGGNYELLVKLTNGQELKRTFLDVPPRLVLPLVTDINASFDNNGMFNVSWKLPDYDYQNATIQIRVDTFYDNGNPRFLRFRVQKLPLVINNYTLLKWESDALRLYVPYIKVQVRIEHQAGTAQSDWKEFKIDPDTKTVTAWPIPVPLTEAQLDQLYNDNFMMAYDIQQGKEGLMAIQTLLNTPLGQRKASTTYSGQLGAQINTIIQMLLSSGKTK